MKKYVDQEQKEKDERSTAYSFIIVGIIGVLLVLALDFNVLSIQLVGTQKVFMSIVMYLLFLIFLVIGIRSYLSLKQISADAKKQKETEDDMEHQFREKYTSLFEDQKSKNEFDNEQEQFFFYNQLILDLLQKEYPDLSESELEHYAEEMYDKLITK